MQRFLLVSCLLIALLLSISPATILHMAQAASCSSSPCLIQDTATATTTYGSSAGSGRITQSAPSNPSALPVVSEVLDQNAQNAQWLITCPDTPNPSNSLEYLTSDPQSTIMGNRCLADSSSPFTTTITRQMAVTWSDSSPASSTVSILLSNLASVSVDNLAYSGETEIGGNGNYNISNGYNSASYIFGQVPAGEQYGIWTWHAEYANFEIADASLAPLQNPDTVSNLQILWAQPSFVGDPWICHETVEHTPPCPTTTTSTVPPTPPSASSTTCVPYLNDGVLSCYSGASSQAPQNAMQFQSVSNSSTAANGTLHVDTQEALQSDDQSGCVSDPTPDCGGIAYTVRNLVPTTYTWTCSYLYNYNVNAKVSDLGSSQIPVPVQSTSLPTSDYLLVNNFPYSPFVASDLPDSSTFCKVDLFHGTPCSSVWTKVSSSATLVLSNGAKYPGLNVYTDSNDPGHYWTVYTTGWLGYFNLNLHSGYVPLSTLQYDSVGALPYLLYNVSIPATLGLLNGREEYLNLSFDIYSPHNYLDPSNSLEPFPLFTDSGIFAAYNDRGTYELGMLPSNTLSLSDMDASGLSRIIDNFLSSLTQSELQGLDLNTILGDLHQIMGSYISGIIQKPVYLSAAPNDYIYALTTTSTGMWWWRSPDIYLYTMRFIPTGYFNLANDQPNAIKMPCSDPSTCAAAWANAWSGSNGYWANALLEQSQNLYITGIDHISDSGSPFWTNGNWQHDSQNDPPSMDPTAITTDYNNDLFMLGCDGSSCTNFKLAEMIPGVGGGNYLYEAGSTPSSFIHPSDLAADPNGQYVYVAGITDGDILLYGAPPTSNFVYIGGISLSYSDSSYNFNIVDYLADGGPFGNALIAKAYSNVAGVNDVTSNHHPLAISDYKGFLYVLDNWTFTVDGRDSAILMLRAFTENGVEIPIDGSSTNYLVPASGDQLSTSTGVAIPQGGWGPYGWPLSANILTTAEVTNPSFAPAVHVSYCAAGCSYSPETMDTHYPPIGPMMSVDGYFIPYPSINTDSFGFSTDFNGTSYLIAHDYQYNDYVDTDGTSKSTFEVGNGGGIQLYTEMLSFRLNIANYTTLSFGADSPYSCYISGNAMPYPNTPCTYDTTGTTANTYAPLLGVPSAFGYVESQGSPEQFSSLSNFVSSLFPSGVSSGQYTSAATQQPVTASCVSSDGTATGTPTCGSGSATCASVTSVSCYSGGVPSCNSGSASCTTMNSDLYCSNGSAPLCDDGSNPACTGSNPQNCLDGNVPTCPPAAEGGAAGTLECNPQPKPSCPEGDAPSCDTSTDPTNTPQCTTQLQPQCSSGMPQCSSGTPQCLSSGTISSPIGASTTAALNTYVNSVITGYLLVPYHYTYQLTQEWYPDPATNGQVYRSASSNPVRNPVTISPDLPESDFTGTLCPDYTLPSPAPAPDPITKIATTEDDPITIYTMNQVDLKSNYLQENIQGGDTFLQQPQLSQSNQNYYISNLSDAGTVVSPDLNYNIYTNRWLGEMFVNLTVSPAASFPVVLASAEVMNAIRSSSYQMESYTQQAFGESFPAYAAQDAIPLSNPLYGADCGGTGCPADYYYFSSASPLASTLVYSNSVQPNLLPLFELEEQSSYQYNLDLDLSQNQNIYGYNRLVYTFVDSFNNIITVPLDADLANIASVTATAQTVTDPENANETNVIVTGTATYSLPSGQQPLPAGSKIYLYYDTDINFYNSISSPVGLGRDSYYQYALQCAFSTSSSGCQLANPLSTLTQPGSSSDPLTFGPTEANAVAFGTQYDYNSIDYLPGNPLAGMAEPQCGPSPKSLLSVSACYQNQAGCECNIYGDYGLTATRSNPFDPTKPFEYCLPVYQNGNGLFTSQLGLIGVASTQPDGTFNAFFTACGSGSESIIAQYYGYPPPEPVAFSQPSLQYSANVFPYSLPDSAFVTSNELNYEYSQASQSMPVNIGSYALSFGGIDSVMLVIAAMALLAFSYIKRAARNPDEV